MFPVSRLVKAVGFAVVSLYLAGCGGAGSTPSLPLSTNGTSSQGAASLGTAAVAPAAAGTVSAGVLDESNMISSSVATKLTTALRTDQVLGVPVGGAQAFYDDFEADQAGGPAAGWSVQNGTWAVCKPPQQSAEYCQTASGSKGGEALAGSTGWKDYHVDADVYPGGDPGHGGVAVIGRVGDATRFYELELKQNVNGSGQLMWYIAKCDGAKWTPLASGPFGTRAVNAYQLRLAFLGNRITAYVAYNLSGVYQPLGGAVDSSYAAGQIGLRSWSTTVARFDRVRVTLDGPTSLVSTPAVPADSLVDIVGTNLHMTFCDATSNYCNANYATMKQLLINSGIRHYRDGATTPNYWPNNRFLDLANAGIHENAVITTGTTPAQLASFFAYNPTAESIEGPNEVNQANDPQYPGDIVALMNTMAPIVHQQALPLIGPSIAWINSTINQYAPLAPIAPDLDYGNLHDYFGGRNPGTQGWGATWNGTQYGSIAASVFVDASMAGSKPAIATETGWSDSAGNVPRNLVARYEPRLFLEHFRAGVHRVFQEQFLDYGGDSFATTGLIDSGMQPKPAYYALKNYIQSLSDPGPSFAPKALAFQLNGIDSSVHQLLMQKRDGSYWLAVWIEGEAWNQDRHALETIPSQAATLSVGAPTTLQLVRVFNDDGSVTDTQLKGASSTPLTITDHLQLIEIK